MFLGGGRDRDGKKLGTNKYFQFESQLNISEIATLLQKMSSLDWIQINCRTILWQNLLLHFNVIYWVLQKVWWVALPMNEIDEIFLPNWGNEKRREDQIHKSLIHSKTFFILPFLTVKHFWINVIKLHRRDNSHCDTFCSTCWLLSFLKQEKSFWLQSTFRPTSLDWWFTVFKARANIPQNEVTLSN